MEPNRQVEMVYNGEFAHGVDEKRRVQVPAMWRPQSAEVEFTVIVWPKEKNGPCLRVLPPKEMAELMGDIKNMPSSDPNKAVLKRVIGSKSIQVTLDKAGRICLPEKMATEAGIKDEVVLVGLLDRFEIWNPEKFAVVKTSDDVMSHEAFKMME